MDEGEEELQEDEKDEEGEESEEGEEDAETARATLKQAGVLILPEHFHGTGAIQVEGENTTGLLFPVIARVTSEWNVRLPAAFSLSPSLPRFPDHLL